MKPSDYLNRNCFFGVSTPGADDIERRYLIGDRQPDVGQRPSRIRKARSRTRATGSANASRTCPRPKPRRILGLTAAELYGVDVDALRPLADKIGPTLDEVHGDGIEFPAPAEAIA